MQFAICNSLLASDNWPEYRGPTGQGVSDSTGLPLTWSETQNVKWKTALDGSGHSTPVVWGDQVWLTTSRREGHERWAVCIDRQTGKVTREVKVLDVATPENIHDLNTHASPSPAIEKGRVYVHFGTQGTACLDTATGKILWKRTDINLDHQLGPGSSLFLYRDLLIFHCDGIDQQYVIALHTADGSTAWRTQRSADLSSLSSVGMRKAFCAPIIQTYADAPPILLSVGPHNLYGYDPETGRELWRMPFDGYSNVGRPVIDNGLLYFSTGYDSPEFIAVRFTHDSAQIVWRHPRSAPQRPSPLAVGGRVYFVNDGGIATCLDGTSGQEIWKHRIGGEHTASPIFADGRIYFFDQSGKTTVIAPGQEFKELAVNRLDEGFMACPAVAGKSLFLRTTTHLYRVEEIAK